MSRRRTERLLNLVLCLLATRRFLTADHIAVTVAGYEYDAEDDKSREAFQRMFERDKAELRALGVPLEVGSVSAFDNELGYRIVRREYQLPEIALEPAEAAAVALAAQLWPSTGLATAASNGVRKLRAAGMELDEDVTLGIEPVVGAEPALDAVMAAVRHRQVMAFEYRGAGREVSERRIVCPWGVISSGGRWYLVGHDEHRGAQRCFRLSRILGEAQTLGEPGAFPPPSDLNLADYFATTVHEAVLRSHIQIRAGAAAGLRRQAERIMASPTGDVATIEYTDLPRFAAELASYGPQVLVLDPAELRAAVIDRLATVVAQSPREWSEAS